jgi:hypothetical protein
MTKTPTIKPAEDWAPVFAYFSGTNSKKFNDKQIEALARQGADRAWCNLCDAPLVGSVERHVNKHMRDLASWHRTRVPVKAVAETTEPIAEDSE